MSIDLKSNKYKACALSIKTKREQKWSWEDIRTLRTTTDSGLLLALEVYGSVFGENVSIDEWHEIVAHEKHDEESRVDIKIVPVIVAPNPTREYVLDTSKGSAWSSYKTVLYDNGFKTDAVNMIEQSSHDILNRLKLDTRNDGAVKGLVIGNVQSGKTANMAALMAMAADQGWNMFVILSGTIENLRQQTQDRLINDLMSARNVSWVSIPQIETSPNWDNALSKLNLSENARHRFLTVCLKNSSRLKKLLQWLNQDKKSREKIKLLIIDDEADQASINTKSLYDNESEEEKVERTAINNYISHLITNKDDQGEDAKGELKAINYIAYTATPYANILNELPGPRSTYPSNFVASLGVSNLYFGPQQIFGMESMGKEPLGIINEISQPDKKAKEEVPNRDEVQEIKDLQEGKTSKIPNSLRAAILWFYCCFAIRRYRGVHKPVSMLIHTSQKQKDQEALSRCITDWINSFSGIDFIKECSTIYEQQTKKFTRSDFEKKCSDYEETINDYPKFSEIADIIGVIFKEKISHIQIDDREEPVFSKGVHLCVDNSSHYIGENGNEHIRLLYPKKELDYATGFIVIGGATLSRGLTLEGLVSSYFLRTVRQADTLMQMGRWFGYRKGYELLPRVWMTKNTQEKFEFLSEMDYELRDKMKYMQDNKIAPARVGIPILEYAKSQLKITAKNKQQSAKIADGDFAGVASQTTMFYDDDNIIKQNYDTTSKFLDLLRKTVDVNDNTKHEGHFLWRDIPNKQVLDYLENMNFPDSNTRFINLKLFKNWFNEFANKNGLEDWNIVFSGSKRVEGRTIGGYSLYTVNRSKKENAHNDGIIRIGALRSPGDLFEDIDQNNIKNKKVIEHIQKVRRRESTDANYQDVRKEAGLEKRPLLIIYAIDKESEPRDVETGRCKMNKNEHIIGLAMVIPGVKSKTKGHTIINLSMEDEEA